MSRIQNKMDCGANMSAVFKGNLIKMNKGGL